MNTRQRKGSPANDNVSTSTLVINHALGASAAEIHRADDGATVSSDLPITVMQHFNQLEKIAQSVALLSHQIELLSISSSSAFKVPMHDVIQPLALKVAFLLCHSSTTLSSDRPSPLATPLSSLRFTSTPSESLSAEKDMEMYQHMIALSNQLLDNIAMYASVMHQFSNAIKDSFSSIDRTLESLIKTSTNPIKIAFSERSGNEVGDGILRLLPYFIAPVVKTIPADELQQYAAEMIARVETQPHYDEATTDHQHEAVRPSDDMQQDEMVVATDPDAKQLAFIVELSNKLKSIASASKKLDALYSSASPELQLLVKLFFSGITGIFHFTEDRTAGTEDQRIKEGLCHAKWPLTPPASLTQTEDREKYTHMAALYNQLFDDVINASIVKNECIPNVLSCLYEPADTKSDVWLKALPSARLLDGDILEQLFPQFIQDCIKQTREQMEKRTPKPISEMPALTP